MRSSDNTLGELPVAINSRVEGQSPHHQPQIKTFKTTQTFMAHIIFMIFYEDKKNVDKAKKNRDFGVFKQRMMSTREGSFHMMVGHMTSTTKTL